MTAVFDPVYRSVRSYTAPGPVTNAPADLYAIGPPTAIESPVTVLLAHNVSGPVPLYTPFTKRTVATILPVGERVGCARDGQAAVRRCGSEPAGEGVLASWRAAPNVGGYRGRPSSPAGTQSLPALGECFPCTRYTGEAHRISMLGGCQLIGEALLLAG